MKKVLGQGFLATLRKQYDVLAISQFFRSGQSSSWLDWVVLWSNLYDY